MISKSNLTKDNVLISEDDTPKLVDFGLPIMKEYAVKFTGEYHKSKFTLRWTVSHVYPINKEILSFA